MTEKKYRETVKRAGGKIDKSDIVKFPDTLRIKTKQAAVDVITALLTEGEENQRFAVDIETPLIALRAAIMRGLV